MIDIPACGRSGAGRAEADEGQGQV
jgi:hypothetical protein